MHLGLRQSSPAPCNPLLFQVLDEVDVWCLQHVSVVVTRNAARGIPCDLNWRVLPIQAAQADQYSSVDRASPSARPSLSIASHPPEPSRAGTEKACPALCQDSGSPSSPSIHPVPPLSEPATIHPPLHPSTHHQLLHCTRKPAPYLEPTHTSSFTLTFPTCKPSCRNYISKLRF